VDGTDEFSAQRGHNAMSDRDTHPAEQTTEDFRVVELDEQPFVGVTGTYTMATLSRAADEIPGLLARLGQLGLAPAGAPFLRSLDPVLLSSAAQPSAPQPVVTSAGTARPRM
jgi:hypothetical protein